MGSVIQAGNKMKAARQSAVDSGIPVDVPAMTVNRVCGSGAQAIASAAQEVMLGVLDSAVAGGVENMDMAPYLVANGRWGYRMGDAQMYDSMLRDGLNDAFSDEHFGRHTEDLAKSRQITREAQHRWAERSQKRFFGSAGGRASSRMKTPVELKSRKRPKVFDKDEHNRPDTTMESLAKLHPAFRKDGAITAGNAPGLNSGAVAMIVEERGWAEQHKLEPMARLVSYGIGAVEPGMFGLGPIPAVRQALDRAGWKLGDIRTYRNQRSVRRDRHCGDTRAGSSRGYRERRRRRDRARSSDRCDGRRADHSPLSFDEARRHRARRRDTVHWGEVKESRSCLKRWINTGKSGLSNQPGARLTKAETPEPGSTI